MTGIKTMDSKLKFAMFFKPMFNVFEMVVYNDPSNYIKEDFTIENFDKYEFSNLRKFSHDTVEPDNNFFEDNDERGIKMVYRVQFVLCKYDNLEKVINGFDMIPSMVAFDGKKVYFTEDSLRAYQFMINVVNMDGGTDLFKSRLNKYFRYGFSIIFPNKTFTVEDSVTAVRDHNENTEPLQFAIRDVDKNKYYIQFGSNYDTQMAKNSELEKQALNVNKALYISTLFCTFVSFLRYVKINAIDHVFLHNDDCPIKDNKFVYNGGERDIGFIDAMNTKYDNHEWYDTFCESIVLAKRFIK